VASLGTRIALALGDLHHQHVVHLDVKPSNIMIRPAGEVVFIDFGLSRHDQLPDLMQEEFRLPYGSAPYMAPEQILGRRSDLRSDLFALGVLMYFFSTGIRPFGDPDRLKGLKRRLWRDPEPPRRLRADFPPWLQEIILRCLEVNPDSRYPTAAQLAFDLNHPDQVKLTERAEKLRRDPIASVMRRWFNSDRILLRQERLKDRIASAPIIAVAIDLDEGTSSLNEALRVTAARILQTVPGARIACLNVLEQGRLSLDRTLDEHGHSKHVRRLVLLKHWAEALTVPEGGITFHVLEAPGAAAAILGYARANPIDHIIMGARANSARRVLLGSVSAEVAAHAPCTVTVVRTR
jgi:nucleotide-binding universal stress UspA family protein